MMRFQFFQTGSSNLQAKFQFIQLIDSQICDCWILRIPWDEHTALYVD